MKRTFEDNNSGGYKKFYQRSNDGYVGLSQRKISKVIIGDKNLQKFSIKFTKTAIPRPVRVKKIHHQHQIDLADMNKMSVIYKGKTCKYIFSLLDVFSRFHWLRSLESKHSSGVKRELKKIYFVHKYNVQ